MKVGQWCWFGSLDRPFWWFMNLHRDIHAKNHMVTKVKYHLKMWLTFTPLPYIHKRAIALKQQGRIYLNLWTINDSTIIQDLQSTGVDSDRSCNRGNHTTAVMIIGSPTETPTPNLSQLFSTTGYACVVMDPGERGCTTELAGNGCHPSSQWGFLIFAERIK